MINKIHTSSAPTTYKAPTGKQEWGVAKNNVSETTPSENTGKAAWSVVTAAKPVETRREETPTKTALTPNSKLDTLGYGNTMLGSTSNNFGFNSSIFKPPANLDQNPTWHTIQADTFMPVTPSLGGVPLNTAVASIPYSGANDSLGSSMFSNIMGSLGLGQRNNFVT
jgi:hypothetical protein